MSNLEQVSGINPENQQGSINRLDLNTINLEQNNNDNYGTNRPLDWKFENGYFINLFTHHPTKNTYAFNEVASKLLLSQGKRISIVSVYNLQDTVLGFQKSKEPLDFAEMLVDISEKRRKEHKNEKTGIQVFSEPIWNQYDQSYIFVMSVQESQDKKLEEWYLTLLSRISDVLIVNTHSPERLKEIVPLCQRDSSVDQSALLLVGHNYSYHHLNKEHQQVTLHQHYHSTIQPFFKQDILHQLNYSFRQIQAYNLLYTSTRDPALVNQMKELRLQLLLTARVRYESQYNMMSSNILSFYIDQFSKKLSGAQQNIGLLTSLYQSRVGSSGISISIDLKKIIGQYYLDIVDHAYALAKTHYQTTLSSHLGDDQPKDIHQLYDIITSTRIAAHLKFNHICEEAIAQPHYVAKKLQLAKIIQDQEISAIQLNEELSDQHCQFVFETNEFQRQLETNGEKKEMHSLQSIFDVNSYFFEQALGTKVDNWFLNFHSEDIVKFFQKSNLQKNQPVIKQTIVKQTNPQIIQQQKELQEQLIQEDKEIERLINQKRQLLAEYEQDEKNFESKKVVNKQENQYLDQIKQLENKIQQVEKEKKQILEKEKNHTDSQQREIDRLKAQINNCNQQLQQMQRSGKK